MNSEQLTDEGVFRMKYKAFMPALISMLFITNGFTRFMSTQEHNTEQIAYDAKRAVRLVDNASEISDYKSEITMLELDVRLLKEKLKECKDEN